MRYPPCIHGISTLYPVVIHTYKVQEHPHGVMVSLRPWFKKFRIEQYQRQFISSDSSIHNISSVAHNRRWERRRATPQGLYFFSEPLGRFWAYSENTDCCWPSDFASPSLIAKSVFFDESLPGYFVRRKPSTSLDHSWLSCEVEKKSWRYRSMYT